MPASHPAQKPWTRKTVVATRAYTPGKDAPTHNHERSEDWLKRKDLPGKTKDNSRHPTRAQRKKWT